MTMYLDSLDFNHNTTTTEKEVIESIENESMDVEMWLHNGGLTAMANSDTSIMVPCADIIGNYAEHLKQAQNESQTEINAVKEFRGY